MSRHYDVVVLGRSIGALTTAALLARRDFTVLLVGQGQRPCGYRYGKFALRRRAFTLLASNSPAWSRIVVELAQSQTWRRRAQPLSPMFQVVAPRRRLDFPPDVGLLTREIEREMPELRRLVDDLYAELSRVNAVADDAFSRDCVWPPGTFWERRETNRIAALLPFVRAEPDADLLAEFPRAHLFRQIVTQSVLFATDFATLPPPFAVARLHGAWTRGVHAIAGGEDELEEFLIERIASYGGRAALGERVDALFLKRGAVAGTRIDGDQNATGATFVVSDGQGEDLAELSAGEGIHRRAQREWPRITSNVGRFVVSLVVRKEGLPEPLGREVLMLPSDPSAASRKGAYHAMRASRVPGRPFGPVVHLQRCGPSSGPDDELLVAEVLLDTPGPIPITEARAEVVRSLIAELPFLERHILVVDSPHDGLPLWLFEDGKRRDVDRSELTDASRRAEPMVRKIAVDPPGFLGLSGEPIRGPIERTLLVGRSVLPALGQEGQLLAAWGAARLITRTDKRKERMRRDMWSKIEIG
ncbi:MAG: phytoene dehydrogenase [Polyangiaceae bacterium]|nr:phytoene dehydrogenase [Polyangiaceae bacterium]